MSDAMWDSDPDWMDRRRAIALQQQSSKKKRRKSSASGHSATVSDVSRLTAPTFSSSLKDATVDVDQSKASG